MRPFILVLLCACAPQRAVGTVEDRDLSVAEHDGGLFTDSGVPILIVDMARNTTSCVGGGVSCSSGNPGACDPGTVTCMGDLAACTPLSMVQSCYDGPAATKDVGACKGGTQTCIAVLGACEGEVVPTQEDCFNDLDDDCDGIVNNGCPKSIGLGALRYLTASGTTNNANETTVETRCPAGAFVVEGSIQYNDSSQSVVGINISCATATLTRTATDYVIGTAAVSPSPYADFISSAAMPTGTPIDAKCNAQGLQAMFANTGDYDSGGYTGMFLRCGNTTPTLNADNTLSLSTLPNTYTVTSTSTADGEGYAYSLQSTKVTSTCMANEIVVGYKGTLSASIDKMQTICAPFVVSYF